MYVLMFTCMCVAAEYRKEGLQKTKQRLQRNCALTMHYLKKTLKTKKKKEKKKKKHTLGQFPLPTDFTFLLFIHFRANGPTYSDKVTLPSLLLIIQTLSLKVSPVVQQTPQAGSSKYSTYSLPFVGAVCWRRDFFSLVMSLTDQ